MDKTLFRKLNPAGYGGKIRLNQRGVALVVTLLLVTLAIGMGMVMFVSTSSDILINGYYQNFRGAFYAADSGINIARASLVNQLNAGVPATFAIPPISNPTTLSSTIATNLTTSYASATALNTGTASGSWSSSFKITGATVSLAPGSPTVTSRDASNNPTGYNYIFNYTLTSQGSSQGTEQALVTDKGSVTLNITGAAASTSVSFAGFGFFVDHYLPCNGSYLVPGTVTGPVFTNGSWTFGTSGSYIFTDSVGQADTNAGFQFSTTCIQSNSSSLTHAPQTIAPTFMGGFNRGQNAIPLPTNDFSQKRAVIDGLGTTATNPTNAELNASLKNVAGTAYPGSGASSGVYLPYSISGGVKTITGGGIYLEGNTNSVTLSTSGASAQIYTIVQGGTTTTITSDPLATPPAGWGCPTGTVGTTTMVSGATTTNICSVTKNLISNTPSTMLFANGSIASMKGPGEGVAAVQDGSQITVTSHGDVTITGDILYKTQPVTKTQNQIVPGTTPPCCNGTPIDTLIPGNDRDQVLGIFSLTGNVNLSNQQSSGNLEIDASVATISASGSGCIVNTGSSIGTLNIVGGRIQSSICNIGATTRNVFFDRRFTNRAAFAPPWFPSTTITQGGALSTNLTTTVQRVQWLNQTTAQ
jgi:Tfp pilus assembly protein PilX